MNPENKGKVLRLRYCQSCGTTWAWELSSNSYINLYGQLSFNIPRAVSPLKVTLVFVLETMGPKIFIVNILNDIYLFGWNKRHFFPISTIAKIVSSIFWKNIQHLYHYSYISSTILPVGWKGFKSLYQVVTITSSYWVFTCLYVFSHKLWHLPRPYSTSPRIYCLEWFHCVCTRNESYYPIVRLCPSVFLFSPKFFLSNCQMSKHCNCR